MTRPRIVVKGSSWLAMETRGGGSIVGDSGSDGDSVGGGCACQGGVFGAWTKDERCFVDFLLVLANCEFPLVDTSMQNVLDPCKS